MNNSIKDIEYRSNKKYKNKRHNPDNLPYVRHKDNDSLNNNYDNLYWCSYRGRHNVHIVDTETNTVYSSIRKASKLSGI